MGGTQYQPHGSDVVHDAERLTRASSIVNAATEEWKKGGPDGDPDAALNGIAILSLGAQAEAITAYRESLSETLALMGLTAVMDPSKGQAYVAALSDVGRLLSEDFFEQNLRARAEEVKAGGLRAIVGKLKGAADPTDG